MSRFFVEQADIQDEYIYLNDQEDINHITKVLRLCAGDTISICDGCGKDYIVRLEKIEKRKIKTKILDSSVSLNEPSVQVTLYQGVPKAAKMEYIVQKATELGITRIIPVMMQRTVVKFDNMKSQQKKIERWQRIAYEAAKQSKRGIIPKVDKPITFDEAVHQMINQCDIQVIPYENETSHHLHDILKDIQGVKNIAIMIGPEGGFDEQEIDRLKQEKNMNLISLGPRILRTETAGVATLAILMYATGNF